MTEAKSAQKKDRPAWTTTATRAAAKLEGEVPPGYRKPASWQDLLSHRDHPERILLIHYDGWKPIDGIEVYEAEVSVFEKDKYGNPILDAGVPRRTRVKQDMVRRGVVLFHGSRLTDLSLTSLRIPEKGERSLHHG